METGPDPALANERKIEWTAQIRVQIRFHIHGERALFDVESGAAIIEIQKRMKLAIDIPIEFRPVAGVTFVGTKVKQDHDIQILRNKWTHA